MGKNGPKQVYRGMWNDVVKKVLADATEKRVSAYLQM